MNVPGGSVINLPTVNSKEGNGFTQNGVTAEGTVNSLNYNNSNNNNRNNSSNIQPPEVSSDLSDTTLTDSSAEEDNVGQSSYFSSGETAVQNGFIVNAASSSEPPLSPTKVMTRKVAPMAAKFAAANDTLAMLKSLSLQAGILTAGSAAASRNPSMHGTSKSGQLLTAVSSSASNQQRFLPSDSPENQHCSQQGSDYYSATSQFSGSSNLPIDFMITSAPVVFGNGAQPSLIGDPAKWLESKQLLSNMSSSQVCSGNASNVNFKNSSNDANSGAESSSRKLFDHFQNESSSDKDSTDSDSSDVSEDDVNEVDRATFAAKEKHASVGGSGALNQQQSGFTSVSKDVESVIPAGSSACFDDETSWTDDDDGSHNVEENTCLKSKYYMCLYHEVFIGGCSWSCTIGYIVQDLVRIYYPRHAGMHGSERAVRLASG